jgi:ACS family hexuronate transporter-like MFS transporter
MAWIVLSFGWRWVFFLTGSLGFIWAWIWLKLYQPPATNRFITAEEREYIRSSLHTDPGKSGTDSSAASVRWRDLFLYREVWGLMGAKFLTDSAWYFFIFWLPKYLGDVRHLNIKEIGYFAWIPFAFSGLGSLMGGWLSSFLLRRNLSLDLSRKIALGISASLMPASLLIVASPLTYAIVFFSTAMFAHQFWSSNVQTLPADIFPARVVGSLEGLLGSAGSFGGMLFGLLVGQLIQNHGYGPAFVMAGVFHPLAFILILTIVRRIQPVAASRNSL